MVKDSGSTPAVRLNVSRAVDLILSMPTTVRSRTDKTTSTEFGRIGTPIAQSFEAATTVGDLSGDAVAGKPAVAIELDSEDKATAKWGGSWKVDGLELSATTVMFYHRAIPVFVIERPSRLDHYRARALRAHLLRLHAEREYLRRMASLLSNDGFIDSVGARQLESIQGALNSSLAVLTRARSFGHLTQDIASAFSGAELETLVDRIQPFRPVIRRRLERLLEQDDMVEKRWREFIGRLPEGRSQAQALGPGTGMLSSGQSLGHEGQSVTRPSRSPAITPSQEESRLAHKGHTVPEVTVMGATLVTIHGFWSSPATWERLNEVWRADEELRGLRIHSFGYPSPKKPRLPFSVTHVSEYDDIAQTLATEYATALANASDMAVVTHSQGGLILQRFLAWMVSEGRARELSRIRSVVMLACPTSGLNTWNPSAAPSGTAVIPRLATCAFLTDRWQTPSGPCFSVSSTRPPSMITSATSRFMSTPAVPTTSLRPLPRRQHSRELLPSRVTTSRSSTPPPRVTALRNCQTPPASRYHCPRAPRRSTRSGNHGRAGASRRR